MIENQEFDEYGISPLFDAAIYNDALKAGEILKHNPKLLEQTNQFGETVLMVAVAFESYLVINIILAQLDMKYPDDPDAISAFLNVRSHKDCTALTGIEGVYHRIIFTYLKNDLDFNKYPTEEQAKVDFTEKVDTYANLMKRGAIFFDERITDDGVSLVTPCYLMTDFYLKSKLLAHALAVYIINQSLNPLPDKLLLILDDLVKRRYVDHNMKSQLELISFYEHQRLQLRELLNDPACSLNTLITQLSWLFISKNTELNVNHISYELERLVDSPNPCQKILRLCAALYAFGQIGYCSEIIENIAYEILQIVTRIKVNKIHDKLEEQVILISMGAIFLKWNEITKDNLNIYTSLIQEEGLESFVIDYRTELEQLIEREITKNCVNQVTKKSILLDLLNAEQFQWQEVEDLIKSDPTVLIACFNIPNFPSSLVPSKYHQQLILLASEYVMFARSDADGVLPCINKVLENEALFNYEKITQLKDFREYFDGYYKLLYNNPEMSWQVSVFKVFKTILNNDYLSKVDICVLSRCLYIGILETSPEINEYSTYLSAIPYFEDIREEIYLMMQLRRYVLKPNQDDFSNIQSNLNLLAGSDTAAAKLIACLKLRLAILKLHHHASYDYFKEKIAMLKDTSSFFVEFNSIKTEMDQTIIAHEGKKEFIWLDCLRNQWQDYYNQCLASFEIKFITEFTLGIESKLTQSSVQSNVESRANTNQSAFFSNQNSTDDYPVQQTYSQTKKIKR